MPFYIYAWIAAITSGLFAITAKLTSKHSIANPWLFNFLLTLAILIFTIPPSLINKATLPNDWFPIILATVFSILFTIFYVFSNYNLDVSTYMPLFNFTGVFAVLIGTSFFGEKLSILKLLFVFIIFIAGIFSSIDEKLNLKSFFRKTVAIALLSTLFLAITNSFVKMALINNSLWTTNLWMAILKFLLLIPTLFLFKNELKKLSIAHVLPITFMGVFSTITGFVANIAYSVNLGVTTLIINTPFSMIFAFLFSIFAPRLLEKHTVKIYAIRFTSTAVMIWAAMQLTK